MVTQPTIDTQKLAYRIDEAVKASGLGRSFLYERLADGSLKSVKIGKCRLIMRDELLRFLSGEPDDVPMSERSDAAVPSEPGRKPRGPGLVKPTGQLELPLRR
ncbi:helix-turn-helix domain-containing protein [Asticcacaulis sp. AND118]|uniref:helix-turn-helix domain-containing protein n=1 Tax=Asticcacaulis sp. AND118 TaxID=2840468 RepID=UPI001CFF91E5|nr:helix-turn-helix domain-containing protein [Asticcacaulis sp. AND118]UDF03280.1 helix-turn-helix domain-containing protein [Asticcacaulis sp. AND118]